MTNIIESNVTNKIYIIRNTKVMLDSDLAEIYKVETRILNQAVKRNIKRFSDEDFMFELTSDEFAHLKSQIVTSSWGGTRKNPKAFTEQGVYMLASVLSSDFAINISKAIMRTFTKMRKNMSNYNLFVNEIKLLRQEIDTNKKWSKDKMGAIVDSIIMLEENIEQIHNTVVDIGTSQELKTIGFIKDED